VKKIQTIFNEAQQSFMDTGVENFSTTDEVTPNPSPDGLMQKCRAPLCEISVQQTQQDHQACATTFPVMAK
jgi:hypothetical protein